MFRKAEVFTLSRITVHFDQNTQWLRCPILELYFLPTAIHHNPNGKATQCRYGWRIPQGLLNYVEVEKGKGHSCFDFLMLHR